MGQAFQAIKEMKLPRKQECSAAVLSFMLPWTSTTVREY